MCTKSERLLLIDLAERLQATIDFNDPYEVSDADRLRIAEIRSFLNNFTHEEIDYDIFIKEISEFQEKYSQMKSMRDYGFTLH